VCETPDNPLSWLSQVHTYDFVGRNYWAKDQTFSY